MYIICNKPIIDVKFYYVIFIFRIILINYHIFVFNIKKAMVILMRDKMYKFAPIIFLIGSVTFWLLAILLNQYYENDYFLWLPFITIQILISTFTGFIISNLHQQVYFDALTGLYNRKYFYLKFSELRNISTMSLILIDIDNFKRINDTYGHIMGDHVLQQFSEILRHNTRKNDIIARWGGEEFAVILPYTDTEEAYKISNRIREKVENYLFIYNYVTCKITVSIGITTTKKEAPISSEQIVRDADEALYKAKEKKNFVFSTQV